MRQLRQVILLAALINATAAFGQQVSDEQSSWSMRDPQLLLRRMQKYPLCAGAKAQRCTIDVT
jgi:hypothetical protein